MSLELLLRYYVPSMCPVVGKPHIHRIGKDLLICGDGESLFLLRLVFLFVHALVHLYVFVHTYVRGLSFHWVVEFWNKIHSVVCSEAQFLLQWKFLSSKL